MDVRLALVLASLPAAVPGAAMAADADLRSLGTARSAVLTDGTRYAVFLSDSTHITVRDDARDRSFEVSNPAECRPVALSEGARMLRECPADPPPADGDGARAESPDPPPDRRYEVVNLTQEAVNDVPIRAGDIFTDIGTRWLGGTARPEPGHTELTYMDWRTGRRASFGEDPSDARVPRNLDSPTLAPLSPPRPAEYAVAADDPFTVAQTGRDTEGRPAYLDLYRGSTPRDFGRRIARLERCGAIACRHITIGGGLVTWVKGRQVRGRALRGGQRVLVRIAAGASAAGLRATHSRKTVYVSLFKGEDESSGFRLYALDWRTADPSG
jgi:hypothetical protein